MARSEILNGNRKASPFGIHWGGCCFYLFGLNMLVVVSKFNCPCSLQKNVTVASLRGTSLDSELVLNNISLFLSIT